MDEIGLEQFSADSVLGAARRKFTGLQLIPRKPLVGRIGPVRRIRVRLRGLSTKRHPTANPQQQRQPNPHDARISETGPRLSTNCSARTSIFCSIVSITL